MVVVAILVRRIGESMWVGTVVVLVGWPGDDVGAVVRARASILAEVELERLNLQRKGFKERGQRRGGGGKGEKKYKQENDGGGWVVVWGNGLGGVGVGGQRDSRIRCLQDKKSKDDV